MEIARIYLVENKIKVMLSKVQFEKMTEAILGGIEELWNTNKGRADFGPTISLEIDLDFATKKKIAALIQPEEKGGIDASTQSTEAATTGAQEAKKEEKNDRPNKKTGKGPPHRRAKDSIQRIPGL